MSTGTFSAWWTGYGTMGVRMDIATGPSSPEIDMTLVDKARMRVWKADASYTPVGTYDAEVLASPAPTTSTISIRYTPASGALPPGAYVVAGLLSLDSGVTYYPTDQRSLTVTPPAT